MGGGGVEAVVSAAAGLVEEAMAMAMAATEVHRLVGAGVVAVETSALGEVVTVAVVQVVEASGEGCWRRWGRGWWCGWRRCGRWR